MMKQLTIIKLETGPVDAAQLPDLMDAHQVAWHSISKVNWPDDYPYRPEVLFRMAYTSKEILLQYEVNEKTARARYGEDNGSVWTDSCVEFFSQPADDGLYYNIECNCIGTVLVECGPDRQHRERAPQEITTLIKRHASLGNQPFEEKKQYEPWTLSLVIPLEVFFRSKVLPLEGRDIRANFYKCGDELTQPHFLSWNAIALPQPNFHCPEFFGEVECR